MKTLTVEEWIALGERLFRSPDRKLWRYVCPVCGHVASERDWIEAGAPESAIAFSCVGRYLEGSQAAFRRGDNSRGCTYAGGGLFQLNPIEVVSWRDGARVSCTFFAFEGDDAT